MSAVSKSDGNFLQVPPNDMQSDDDRMYAIKMARWPRNIGVGPIKPFAKNAVPQPVVQLSFKEIRDKAFPDGK